VPNHVRHIDDSNRKEAAAGEFGEWLEYAFDYLKATYGLNPRDLTGNRHFLMIDFEAGASPQESIDQWYERECG
jgi:hypothetical protein